MTNQERINTLREVLSENISALEKCRIFLTALYDHEWLGHQKHQIKDLLDEVVFVAKKNEQFFIPEVINPEE